MSKFSIFAFSAIFVFSFLILKDFSFSFSFFDRKNYFRCIHDIYIYIHAHMCYTLYMGGYIRGHGTDRLLRGPPNPKRQKMCVRRRFRNSETTTFAVQIVSAKSPSRLPYSSPPRTPWSDTGPHSSWPKIKICFWQSEFYVIQNGGKIPKALPVHSSTHIHAHLKEHSFSKNNFRFH